MYYGNASDSIVIKANPLATASRPADPFDGSLTILTARLTATTQELYFNGTLVGSNSTSISDYDLDNATFEIGNSWVGRIGHVLVYDDTPTTNQLGQTGSELARLYGLGWDPSILNPGPDELAPQLADSDALSPAPGSISSTTEFRLTFGEAVVKGTGNIVIRRRDDHSVVETIGATGVNVVVDGTRITFTTTVALPLSTEFYIEVDAGAFKDLAGNSFAGISGPDIWYFTTPLQPQLHIGWNGANLDFWWNSRLGMAYDLVSSTDLSSPTTAWPVYDPDGEGGIAPHVRIFTDGETTTLASVPTLGPRRFFAVLEKDAPPLVEAHRGDSVNAPENTIASINSAATSADLSEMDARVSADGVLVLMHDATVDRTTDGTGSVGSMTLAQLKALDAGSWKGAAFTGEQVPTLQEAITACLSQGLEPLFERKDGDAATYHALLASMSLDPGSFRVICFDASFLNALNALNPDYRLGFLGSGTITQTTIDSAKANGADFLDWAHAAVDQAAVDLVHANGMELHVWTVNDATRMQQLIDYGIDGITTDNPALLRSLIP